MLSFYQKLATKLSENTPGAPVDVTAAKTASFKGNGERVDAPAQPTAAAAAAATHADDQAPDGTDTLEVDLFQSEERMVLFVQMSGVAKDALDLTLDEETNTIIIQVTQVRPALPPLTNMKVGVTEKGRYVKQEVGWKNLYRKVYLPASFDSGESQAFLEKGVLVVVLPSKHPGAGKKLSVTEIPDEKHESPIQK